HRPRHLRLSRRRLRSRRAPRPRDRDVADGGHRRPPGSPRPAPLDPHDARRPRPVREVRVPEDRGSLALHGDRGPRGLPKTPGEPDFAVNAPLDWWKSFFEGLAIAFWGAAIPPEATAEDAAFLWKHLALWPGARVLDVPCGLGRLARVFAGRG